MSKTRSAPDDDGQYMRMAVSSRTLTQIALFSFVPCFGCRPAKDCQAALVRLDHETRPSLIFSLKFERRIFWPTDIFQYKVNTKIKSLLQSRYKRSCFLNYLVIPKQPYFALQSFLGLLSIRISHLNFPDST